MKGLIALAVIFAVVGTGFLIATLFTSATGSVVTLSIGAGLALLAFIITLVAYVNKSVK